jgi:hypothetical protein
MLFPVVVHWLEFPVACHVPTPEALVVKTYPEVLDVPNLKPPI